MPKVEIIPNWNDTFAVSVDNQIVKSKLTYAEARQHADYIETLYALKEAQREDTGREDRSPAEVGTGTHPDAGKPDGEPDRQ